MIKNYIETVTIIDNTESEVEGLIKIFKKNNILYEYFHPIKFEGVKFKLKNRKLIFLDLYLNSSIAQNAASQISSIRNYFKKIIGKKFGLYGIVLWTKHPEDLKEFKEKIFSDGDEYTLPVFIVGLNKNGIDWDAIDRNPVGVVFLIGPSTSDEAQKEYLQVVSKLMLLLKNKERREELIDAKSGEEVESLFDKF